MTVEITTIELPSIESAIALAGAREENLKILSQHTGAKLALRGQELVISGTPQQIERTTAIVRSLQPFWKEGKRISKVDIRTASYAIDTGRLDDLQAMQHQILARTRRGEEIRAKTIRQWQYIQAVRTHDLTFCIGPSRNRKDIFGSSLSRASFAE